MNVTKEVLENKNLTLSDTMRVLINIIPIGFTQPKACRARITLLDEVYESEDFYSVQILHASPLKIADEKVGEIVVGCICELLEGECRLLNNEIKLVNSIAQRISQMTLEKQRELYLMLDMLKSIDPDMLYRVGEKMRIYLKKKFGAKADKLLDDIKWDKQSYGELNTPIAKPPVIDAVTLSNKLIACATAYLPQEDIVELISTWIKEQRILALVRTVDNKDASIRNILDAIRKYT